MTKRFIILCVAVLMICCMNLLPVYGVGADVLPSSEDEVTSVLDVDLDKSTAARFENMLNNNYAYGETFNSYENIIAASQLSLLANAIDGKIKNSDIYAFVKNMYGIDLKVAANENQAEFNLNDQTEIIPRGYTKYTHSFVKAEENADSTVTVYTTVSEQRHDSEVQTKSAIAVFVKNEASAFGYNLFSCEIIIE